eukprot:scaffold120549_cov22-Tisochrysis_lutea.AAC.1
MPCMVLSFCISSTLSHSLQVRSCSVVPLDQHSLRSGTSSQAGGLCLAGTLHDILVLVREEILEEVLAKGRQVNFLCTLPSVLLGLKEGAACNLTDLGALSSGLLHILGHLVQFLVLGPKRQALLCGRITMCAKETSQASLTSASSEYSGNPDHSSADFCKRVPANAAASKSEYSGGPDLSSADFCNECLRAQLQKKVTATDAEDLRKVVVDVANYVDMAGCDGCGRGKQCAGHIVSNMSNSVDMAGCDGSKHGVNMQAILNGF